MELYFGEGSTTTNNVCWIFPEAAFWCMQEHPNRALCQLFASPLYLREAAGAWSPGAADPRCAPAAGAGRGAQLCLCSFVQQPCPPSASTIAHCHTGVLEVIQGETVLHRCRREAGAMRRSSSCSSCSMQGLCSVSAAFPLGGPSLLTEAKIKAGGRAGMHSGLCTVPPGKASLPIMLTESNVATYSGAVHIPRACWKGPPVQCLATVLCSLVPSCSGWINVSVTLLTSQNTSAWYSSFAEEKKLTFKNAHASVASCLSSSSRCPRKLGTARTHTIFIGSWSRGRANWFAYGNTGNL